MSKRKWLFLMSREQGQAFVRLLRAAESGSGDAACRLGDMYRVGSGGMRASPKLSFRWYARSALAGDANGQNNLGACFEHGIGCRQSYTQAVKWYRLAADQSLSTASANLGHCYRRGHGVTRDFAQALAWFGTARKQGCNNVDEIIRELEGSVRCEVTEQRDGRRVLRPEQVRFTRRTAGMGYSIGLIGGLGPREHDGDRSVGE